VLAQRLGGDDLPGAGLWLTIGGALLAPPVRASSSFQRFQFTWAALGLLLVSAAFRRGGAAHRSSLSPADLPARSR
jgi:hypothetical protein